MNYPIILLKRPRHDHPPEVILRGLSREEKNDRNFAASWNNDVEDILWDWKFASCYISRNSTATSYFYCQLISHLKRNIRDTYANRNTQQWFNIRQKRQVKLNCFLRMMEINGSYPPEENQVFWIRYLLSVWANGQEY